MNKNTHKIDALTGLRFVAALMIVLRHTNGVLFNSAYLGSFAMIQGVSVFFVLSGFILTYVYPTLAKKDVARFVQARFARIWPAHVAGIGLLCLMQPQYVHLKENFLYLVVSLSLIGSWIPIEKFYSVFNIPSWSISTEFFFYLCFPFLIYRFSKTWHLKLALTLLIALIIVMLCTTIPLPIQSNSVDTISLVYSHPLCRIFEFTLGMCTALLFNKLYLWINPAFTWVSFVVASVVEVLSFSLLYFSLKNPMYWYYPIFGGPADPPSPGEKWASWSSSSSVVIALFILCLAFQKGIISRFLSLSVMILLGEISYSLYLIHYTFLSTYVIHVKWFNELNTLTKISLFAVSVLVSAYLIWRFIEIPSRRLIRRISWPRMKSATALDESTPLTETT